MTNKQGPFNTRAGYGPPAFYYAFAFIDGPVARWFFEAHLELLRYLLAYLREKREGWHNWVVGSRL